MLRTGFLMICLGILVTGRAQQADEYLRLGDSLYYSNPDTSYYFCCCAEKAAIAKKDAKQIAISRLCKVRYLILKTEYEAASADLGKAIDQFKKSGDKENLARAYNSKSILLERLGDDDGKYNYQNEAVRLYEETGNTEGLVKMLSNLSLSYTYDKRFEEAANCLDRILMMMDQLKQTDIYFYYQNRGIYHMHRNEFEKAIVNLEAALVIAREQKMVDSEITALTRLAEANTELKKYTPAQELLAEARTLAEKNNLGFELDEVYTALIHLYTAQEKYRQAFETLTLQNEQRERSDQLQRIHHIYNQDRKNERNVETSAALQHLKKENKRLQEKESTSATYWWIMAAMASVLFLGLCWSLWTIWKLRQKNQAQRETLERLYRKEESPKES